MVLLMKVFRYFPWTAESIKMQLKYSFLKIILAGLRGILEFCSRDEEYYARFPGSLK